MRVRPCVLAFWLGLDLDVDFVHVLPDVGDVGVLLGLTWGGGVVWWSCVRQLCPYPALSMRGANARGPVLWREFMTWTLLLSSAQKGIQKSDKREKKH